MYSAIIASIAFVGCKDTSTKSPEKSIENVSTTASKYKLTAFAPSVEFNDATINKYSMKDGKFSFDITGTDYKLGEQTPDAGQKCVLTLVRGNIYI